MENMKLKRCEVCEHAGGTLRTNGLVMCTGCEYDPSKRKLVNSLERLKNKELRNDAHRLAEENAELREALQSALNIKKLWLPQTNMVFHTEEFCALHKMHDSFKRLL